MKLHFLWPVERVQHVAASKRPAQALRATAMQVGKLLPPQVTEATAHLHRKMMQYLFRVELVCPL